MNRVRPNRTADAPRPQRMNEREKFEDDATSLPVEVLRASDRPRSNSISPDTR